MARHHLGVEPEVPVGRPGLARPRLRRRAALERHQLATRRPSQVAQERRPCRRRAWRGTRPAGGGRRGSARGCPSGARRRSTRGARRPWRVTVEVSTRPSGPPVPSRAAALAAETVPMLVPTSHTGTAASVAQRRDHRPHVLGVGGGGAEAVEPVRPVRGGVDDRDQQAVLGEAGAVADEEVATEARGGRCRASARRCRRRRAPRRRSGARPGARGGTTA